MNVVFRADASTLIGSGHVMRCLVIAKLLIGNGHQVAFATRPQNGDFVAHIKTMGIDLIELNQPEYPIKPMHDSDYDAWLQVTWQDDVKDFLQKVSDADLIIVDHYGINYHWEMEVSNALQAKLFAIDDIVREHHADLVLDQTFGRSPLEYRCKKNGCTILAGSNYSMLAPEFSRLRLREQYSEAPRETYKVLVSMGAIDKPNVTLAVLKKLKSLNNIELAVTVLLSERSPHYESVKTFCNEHYNINHLAFTTAMAQLMSEHHIAIGAPGSTSWERACLGLPCIIIPIAENQCDIARNIANSGAAILLELDRITVEFDAVFDEICLRWQQYHEASLQLTDGLGAKRVTDEIEKLFA